MKIDGREIGAAWPPYLIAELSANHAGSLKAALQGIDAAKAAGADAVKIQTYTPDTMTLDHRGPGFVIEGGLWDGRTLYDLYQEAHTPYAWHPALFEHARKVGITLFSTPFDTSAIELLESLNAPAYKIASFELTDLPLIERAAQTGKPLILSTGMADEGEIEKAVQTARANGARELLLLHCTSAYPAPIDAANVRSIPFLAGRFGVLTGLSDHTPGDTVACAAVALGAVAVEKHFTPDRGLGGPDAAFSVEPAELKTLKSRMDETWRALGEEGLVRGEAERENRRFRRSLYAAADIRAGEAFTPQNVRAIRPGYGLPPAEWPRVLASKAACDIRRGTPLHEALIKV